MTIINTRRERKFRQRGPYCIQFVHGLGWGLYYYHAVIEYFDTWDDALAYMIRNHCGNRQYYTEACS